MSDEEHQACIEWLYSYITPWDLVINKWKLTAHRRLHSFETLDLDINEYVQAFPCLSKTSQVADLVSYILTGSNFIYALRPTSKFGPR